MSTGMKFLVGLQVFAAIYFAILVFHLEKEQDKKMREKK
jgi:hypothetical protein